MNEMTQPAVAGPVEPTVRPCAWMCEYRSGEEFVSLAKDPMCDPDVRSAFPLVMKSALDAAHKDAERWRKLRDTPATHMLPGPMRQCLFARPGGADSMDRMVDEWPGPNVMWANRPPGDELA